MDLHANAASKSMWATACIDVLNTCQAPTDSKVKAMCSTTTATVRWITLRNSQWVYSARAVLQYDYADATALDTKHT